MARKKPARTADEPAQPADGRQAWVRAGAGLSLIAALMVALSFFDQRPAEQANKAPAAGGADDGKPEPAPTIVTTPREPLITSAVALPSTEQAVPALLDQGDTEPAPEATGAPEIAPPQAREADEPPPTAKMAASMEASNAPRLVLRSAPKEPDAAPVDSAATLAGEAKRSPQGGAKGYLLQLGVFGHSSNAQALFEKLRSQGLPARLETRVVAGPFATRKSAEAARERLARAGMARGLVVSEK